MRLSTKVIAFCAFAVVGLGLTAAFVLIGARELEARSEGASAERRELVALHHVATRASEAMQATAEALERKSYAPIELATAALESAVAELRAITPADPHVLEYYDLAKGGDEVIALMRQALTIYDGDLRRTMRELVAVARARLFTLSDILIEDELRDSVESDLLVADALTTLRTLAIGLPIGLLALLALLTLAFLPRFTRGMRAIERATRQIGAGDLETRVALAGHDELARVGNAFNRMSESLGTARAALVDALARAEQSDRAKSEFIANMSHEIRTPIHGVLGLAALLGETELSQSQRDQLALLDVSGKNLLELLNAVLDFSKIEAGREEVAQRRFDLGELVADVVKGTAARAAAKGIEVVLDLVELPKTLEGDDVKVRQIVVNLLHNAVKFTPGGEIVVTATATRDGERTDVELRVSDTGIGIPAERRAAIFEAFTQADGSITRRYGGSGLGLAIVSRLVHMLGGTVALDSEVGRGTTFIVRLPFRGARDETRSEPELAGLRALVVDGRSSSRDAVARMLRGFGMMVDTSAQPSDTSARVMLVDAAALEAMKPRPEVAVVALLSPGASAETARCRALGIEAWVTKPPRPGELSAAMLRALKPDTRVPSTPALPAAPARRLKILAAEDNVVNQHVLLGVLGRRGHAVTIVANGREALARVRAEPWDLVVMDVQMPEMDGLAATASIRAHESTVGGHVPILGMTAHTQPSDRERCLASGMDAYLPKPVDVHVLIATVEGQARVQSR